MINTNLVIKPNWPAPKNIQAYTTLKSMPFKKSYENRSQLIEALRLPSEPIWLTQAHTNIVLPAIPENRDQKADASFTRDINNICIVTTADCLPVLLCERKGSHVAAIHAGWRGVTSGIIYETLNALSIPGNQLIAWIGPAISQTHFEVGDEVRTQALSLDPEADFAFIPSPNGRWLCDLIAIARLQLKKQGVIDIYGGEYCTYSNENQFYSYRRDGQHLGNMASLIWISDSSSSQ